MLHPETIQSNPFFTLFEKQQNNRYPINNRSARERCRVLSALEKSLHHHRAGFQEALLQDFRKPATETDLTELYPLLAEIRNTRANLRNWMRPERVANTIVFAGTKNSVIRAAKGVCLIISPWNYPLLLTFGPMIAAIAAGNTVILKPSELTPHTSSLMKKIVAELFPEEEIAIVEGDKSTSESLLELPFDHILFTGNHHVGASVMHAAANHLTSVTLELGGKSPVYIHHDADINDAAAKITAAKLVNAGQTCVAPDYILVHHELKPGLVKAIEKSMETFYNKKAGGDRENFASIINRQHYERLEKLFPRVKHDEALRKQLLFEPLIIQDLSWDDPSLKDEIFGPVLPVISVMNEEEALKIIHQFPEPLCLYLFTRDRKLKNHFINTSRSGSICFNECALHFLHPGLPFGGIHKSGIGRTHGKAGFLSFSEERVIFEQRIGFTMAKLLYPPYNFFKKKLIDLVLKYF